VWPVCLGVILLLALALRLHDLPTRGTWDADQGHDMLVLRGFVHDGVFPLLGPPTSIGDFHHGALYYYVLAPAAWLGGGDPTIVVGEIALLGVVAAGLVAGLARAVGGLAAGVAAGLLMAVSATAVDESTFLWNPNLVAFGTAVAISGAWRAGVTGHVRWWLLAAAGLAVTMQSHVLGVALLAPMAAWLLREARRAGADETAADETGVARRRLLLAGLGGLLLIAVSYAPLLASELQTGFHESRAAVAFLAGGGQASAAEPLVRMVFVTLRILAWPLTGLLTDALTAGVLAAIGFVGLLVWRVRVAVEPERGLARWIAATLVWSCAVLGVGVSSLASVTPLPVDHYHAFIDPLVFIGTALGIAGLWRLPVAGRATVGTPGRVAAVALVGVLVAWNVTHQPAAVNRDGGYPAAVAAASRIVAGAGDRPGLIVSLPPFKTPEAYAYPLVRAGSSIGLRLTDPKTLTTFVVVCDALFVKECGGPAEDAAAAEESRTVGGAVRLTDRFVAAPGRTISVYLAASASRWPGQRSRVAKPWRVL
jgi:flagellar biosynthesis protein FliQ